MARIPRTDSQVWRGSFIAHAHRANGENRLRHTPAVITPQPNVYENRCSRRGKTMGLFPRWLAMMLYATAIHLVHQRCSLPEATVSRLVQAE